MHYYQFNISDYESHTKHLTEIEDLAYRRMIDWCYLHESSLPESIEEIAKKICMRTHSDCIANVLHEFFQLTESGYIQGRIEKEVAAYHAKSEKAKASAEARWSKKPNKNNKKANNANALQTYSERNAKHKTLNNKHKTTNSVNKRFAQPTKEEAQKYFMERGCPTYSTEAQSFIDFYDAKGWMIGKNKMKDWKAAIRNWMKNYKQPINQQLLDGWDSGLDGDFIEGETL
jgi:uncharacterized protein YdaU (DUF1376 family)